MRTLIQFSQITISVIVILLILLQARGVGLGRAFGGGDFYKSKRGVEKIVFRLTILFVILFTITSILSLLYS